MILDSSAIVAVVIKEPGFEALLPRLAGAGPKAIGAPTLVETSIVLCARLKRDARGVVSRILDETGTLVIPFTDAHYAAAVAAWIRYGKGRHPAALNFGDCLTYAVARLAAEPLLCVGDDFAKTDIELA